MEIKVLLSIIIPTYNRYKYLFGSIDAMLDTISSKMIEIIIQDNTEDNTAICDYIAKKNDPRIKYFHESKRLTVSENCTKGIKNSQGKYLCLIGDDDAMCSSVIDLVTLMDKYDIDACNFDPVIYHWPDLKSQVPSLDSLISPKVRETIEICDSKKILEKEIENGLQKIYAFPRAYHAIIARSVMEDIFAKVGTYFPGPSPDMANAALCCIYSKRQIKIGVPMMISGYGLASTGGMGRQRKHNGSLKGKDWLPSDVEERWNKKIPLLWLGCTIWPESAFEALDKAGKINMLKNLNYGIIYGETLIQSKKDAILPIFKCKPSFSQYIYMAKHIFNRIVGKIVKTSDNNKIINNSVENITEASEFQNKINSKIDLTKMFENL